MKFILFCLQIIPAIFNESPPAFATSAVAVITGIWVALIRRMSQRSLLFRILILVFICILILAVIVTVGMIYVIFNLEAWEEGDLAPDDSTPAVVIGMIAVFGYLFSSAIAISSSTNRYRRAGLILALLGSIIGISISVIFDLIAGPFVYACALIALPLIFSLGCEKANIPFFTVRI